MHDHEHTHEHAHSHGEQGGQGAPTVDHQQAAPETAAGGGRAGRALGLTGGLLLGLLLGSLLTLALVQAGTRVRRRRGGTKKRRAWRERIARITG